MISAGCLYVVATPLGNLEDLSPRAVAVLRSVACVAAEDTRRFAQLAQRFAIDTPRLALHEHNEDQQVATLLARLQAGEALALVSDAGTPLISDPGFRLVAAAQAAGVTVVPVPGPCAAIAALSAAGLPSDRFVFEGFLPAKQAARRARLQALAEETRTLIFYESVHRIVASAADLCTCLGAQRRVVVARELTKLHEQIVSLPLQALVGWLQENDNHRRGEFVLLVAGAEATASQENRLSAQAIFELLAAELPPGKAARLAHQITGLPRSHFYARHQAQPQAPGDNGNKAG